MSDSTLEELVAEVQANPRYRSIDPGLARRITGVEMQRHKSRKEVVKAARSRLHQIGGAYLERSLPFGDWTHELASLDHDLESPVLRQFCQKVMQQHASTQERLPILDTFFAETLARLGPIHSVMDIACGLNPLALAWMPLAKDAEYYACDIFTDLVGFVDVFLAHAGLQGEVETRDAIHDPPMQPVQLALLLKTLPVLEQQEKGSSLRLLKSLNAGHLLISYPTHSLGGRQKGMVKNYEDQFLRLMAELGYPFERFEFTTELAFLVEVRK